ncbi:MAG TPA: S-layer homology domain-containing protein [Bryobacteraceae bacterium]|nr:S-layer homology domain-containing protein [Bryobacteraceae bacterium]
MTHSLTWKPVRGLLAVPTWDARVRWRTPNREFEKAIWSAHVKLVKMRHLWMPLVVALAGLTSLRAQTQGSGRASVSSTFDPATSARGSITPGKFVAPPRRSVLSPEEEAAHRNFITPRSPAYLPQPPRLQTSNELSGTRAPVSLRAPLRETPSTSFQGIPQTELLPPSPNVASGPDDILEVVNSRITRFTKEGQATDTVHMQQWFQANLATMCPSNLPQSCILGDVSIRYDQIHGRFLMTMQVRDDPADTSYLAISVSNGATYASGWKNWILNAKLDGTAVTQNYADFPQVGFDDKAVYISMLMFRSLLNSFAYAKIRILKKTDLYNPALVSLPYKDLFDFKNQDNTPAATLMPVHVRGRVGVGPPGAVLINSSTTAGADYLTLWRITDPTGTPAAVRSTLVGSWKYGKPAPAPQLGTITLLDTGPADILKAIYREGTLYAAQNAGNLDEPTTVVYSKIDVGSNKISQQSRYINGNFFYPAFDVPATVGPNGDLPNKLITGTTTTSAGALTYAGLKDVKDGEDTYRPIGDGQARYGEYFGGSIDPVNGGLWVAGEYVKPKINGVSQWGTWVSYFPWSTSPLYDDVLSTSPFFDFINVIGQYSITKGCTARTFCPGSVTTRSQMAAFVVRSIYGDTFTFSSTPAFTDVPVNHPQFQYIQKLKELGITQGCTVTAFCPDAPVTRAQAAVFVIRAKFGPLFGDNFTFPQAAYFSDVPSTNSQFPFVQKLREMGITQGCAPGRFCPDDTVLREQMATFLTRAFLN